MRPNTQALRKFCVSVETKRDEFTRWENLLPRKDLFHDAFRNALIKAGWTITHDPFAIRRGGQTLYIDIGAETPLAAEKEGRKIAVEIKSLVGKTDIAEFERGLGQYFLYRSLLKWTEPERSLFLGVTIAANAEYFDNLEGVRLISDENMKLIVFDPFEEAITQWIE